MNLWRSSLLPILKKASQTGVIVQHRKPDEVKTEEQAPEQSDIESIASDMIRAFEQKDAKTLAMLLKEAHDCCAQGSEDSEESNDYDSLNQKAAAESAE